MFSRFMWAICTQLRNLMWSWCSQYELPLIYSHLSHRFVKWAPRTIQTDVSPAGTSQCLPALCVLLHLSLTGKSQFPLVTSQHGWCCRSNISGDNDTCSVSPVKKNHLDHWFSFTYSYTRVCWTASCVFSCFWVFVLLFLFPYYYVFLDRCYGLVSIYHCLIIMFCFL